MPPIVKIFWTPSLPVRGSEQFVPLVPEPPGTVVPGTQGSQFPSPLVADDEPAVVEDGTQGEHGLVVVAWLPLVDPEEPTQIVVVGAMPWGGPKQDEVAGG